MYEVSGAAAYAPEVWQTSYKPKSRDPFTDRRLPSPPTSPVRKPVLSDSTSSVVIPPQHQRRKLVTQSPTQESRYWDKRPGYMDTSPQRASPERYRRPAAEIVKDYSIPQNPHSLENQQYAGGLYRQTPIGANEYPEIPPLRPNKHRYQDSIDSDAPLAPASAVFMSPPRPHYRNNMSPTNTDNYNSGSFAGAGYVPDHQRPAFPERRRSEWDDIDPETIDDRDGDDPFDTTSPGQHHRGHMPPIPPVGALGAVGGATGLFKAFSTRDPSGNYGKLSDHHRGNQQNEKSTWNEHDNLAKKRRMRIIWIILAVLVLLAIVGGVVGGILASKKSHSSASSTSSADTSSDSTLDDGLTASSSKVKALMNNPNLHKVFPALDYTGINMQYPACLTDAPIQDNVTLDVAIMSQLSPSIRLYGTDCNQTEMVLTAIDRLDLNTTMTVWLGVWLANNDTTNTRQLTQMYDILRKYPKTHFKGIIVGNEVLFRKDLSLAQLGKILTDVRSNLTAQGIDLPIATSDLGSDWTAELVTYSDLVLANNHPFFAGVTAAAAAGWTWDFWQTNDVALTTSDDQTFGTGDASVSKNIISETGWPSQGGNDCGTDNVCAGATDGSVAGIEEMNTFMEGWVCQALENGTDYFWFEAFDEPWKVIYDTASDQWEDHW